MSLAVSPPIRLDLGLRTNSDELVPLLWLRADGETPIAIVSAVLTMRFDLPDDDTWVRDPDTDEPIAPGRQTIVITGVTPGSAEGWIDTSRYALGEVLVYISHGLWADKLPPLTGTWDLVAVSGEGVQRCLVRGGFAADQGADQP